MQLMKVFIIIDFFILSWIRIWIRSLVQAGSGSETKVVDTQQWFSQLAFKQKNLSHSGQSCTFIYKISQYQQEHKYSGTQSQR
jgi:hypothetical protein